ncbi:CAP domain-containing protein [Jonesia quinghaiensis]|uniref:CAP domain-containing protein n=1 Tax=Jonesia quinghaiensis TaxID=262806 RepID=UPI00146BDB54|nr:CAP domain-containing protein [Jonesia quinghaiensis]
MRHSRRRESSWPLMWVPIVIPAVLISGIAAAHSDFQWLGTAPDDAPDIIASRDFSADHGSATPTPDGTVGGDAARHAEDLVKNVEEKAAEAQEEFEKAEEEKAERKAAKKAKAAAQKKAEQEAAANNDAQPSEVSASARTSTATVAPETGVLDTASRSAVRSAYRSQVKENLVTEPQPKVNGCSVEATPDATRTRSLETLNFSRSLAGLSPVSFSADFNAQSEEAALVQHLQGHLSHTPSSGSCDLPTGVKASGEANISMGTHGARNVLAYLEDGGDGNAAVGHRKHILNPGQEKMGIGFAGNYGAMYVFGATDSSNPTPQWIPWPTAGYFPSEMEPNGRWSFTTTQQDVDFSSASVSVTRGDTKVNAEIIHRDGSGARYGDQAGITFVVPESVRQLNDSQADVTVTVSGIRSGGQTLDAETYKVKLFAAS